MEIIQGIILLSAGLFAGFLNVVAGGGSLITLPALIMVGLPAPIANATNRVAILFQNTSAYYGFKKEGYKLNRKAWIYILPTIPGSVLGAYLASEINAEALKKIISFVIVLVAAFTFLLDKRPSLEKPGARSTVIIIISMFGVGLYGGFIQAGVGFLILLVLNFFYRFDIHNSNFLKISIVLVYTVFALLLFQGASLINWKYGLVLALGNSTGGYIASRYSVKRPEKWVKRVIFVALVMVAIHLWFR